MSVGRHRSKTAAAPADPETAKDDPATATQASASPPRSPMQKVLPGALLVPIDRVERDPAQPRRDWQHGEGRQRLEELTHSVREFGLLQPLLVRQEGERYVVIAGGRRLVAARRAGLTEVPVVVHHADSATVRILQLLENLQRQELSPTDEARAYQELMDLQGLTPPKIALRVRRHEQHVRDRLRLLRDQVLSDAVERRQISATVAREINKLPDEIAEKLRQRVQDGARLLQKDIDETRAHMARDGIVHPRLAPRADRMPGPVLEGQVGAPATAGADRTMPARDLAEAHGTLYGLPSPEETALPRWLDVDRHRSVHSDKEAFHSIQQDYQ